MDIIFGTKVYDSKKRQVGIVVKTYNLGYVDNPGAMGAKVIDPEGRSYPTNLDNLLVIGDLAEDELVEYAIPEWFSR